ncbi:MAG: efflux transporter outer membrane subunit [Reyranellaceae bacterium]
MFDPTTRRVVRRRRVFGMGFAVLAGLAGCDPVGPNYVRPEPPVPTQFVEAGPWKEAVPQDTIARGDWWTVFGDPTLDRLQAEAVRQNPDLRAAANRVLQAQAIAGISKSYMYPELQVGALAQRFANNSNFATLVDPATVTANTASISSGFKAVPLYATWEIDFWGRIRRQMEAAMAELGASVAAYQTALLTLNGEIAQAYFELRTTDELQRIIDDSIALYRGTFELVKARRANGLSGDVPLSEAETALRTIEAQSPPIEAQRIRLVNKLAVLIGSNPESLTIGKELYRPTIPAIPVGLPSDLLQRRPDIAKAERDLVAYNARIGVAVAAYFPTIQLTSAVGFESFALSTLTQPTSNIWGIGLSLFQLLFNSGRTTLNVERSRAAYEEHVALYQALLLKSFQEVETALAGLRQLALQARLQQTAVGSAGSTATLASQRFQQGLVSMLDVLTAQRAVLTSRTVALQITNDQLMTTVALIKALGGGWQDRAQQMPEGLRSMWAPPLKQ